jgi:tetratricopeptide (TPR) repeat protein
MKGMADKDAFRFTVRQPAEGTTVSFEEAETFLLKQVAQTPKAEEPLWQLARLYSAVGRHDESIKYLKRLWEGTNDPEKTAATVLAFGQLMEQKGDYEGAITYYSQALSLEPSDTHTWFFIHNNLGFCLNHFAAYAEGERYCRKAIDIDPDRPNGFKNLGISLQGQGRMAEAASMFIQAVRVEASDPRSLHHLEALVAGHPEVSREIPDIQEQLIACREAVRVAQEVGDKLAQRLQLPHEPRGKTSS